MSERDALRQQDEPDEPASRIDRLLRELGSAEPAAGLEQRVLQRLEERAAARDRAQPFRWWRELPGSVGESWKITALAASLVLAAALWFAHGRPATPRSAEHMATGAPVQPASSGRGAAPAMQAEAGHGADRSVRVGHAARPAKARPASRPALAEDRLLALGNHPAPEAPLTDEERLLLRIAHHAGPDEFAVLNPDARDARAMADKAEFRRFFGPPVTGGSE